MFRRTISRLGAAKSAVLMSSFCILGSLLIYLVIALASGTFRPVGLLISLITPAIVAPPACIILLRIAFSLFHTREDLLKVREELEGRVSERTQELWAANELLRGEIQERKQAEYAMRDSEAQYRLLAENVADVVWTLDIQSCRFTYVSPSIRKLTGFTPEGILGHTLADILPPESLQKANTIVSGLVDQFSAGAEPRHGPPHEYDLLRSDGSTVPVEVVSTLLPDKHGRPGILLGMTRDITDRKKTEEKLLRRREEYRSIFEQTMIGIFQSTPDGRYLTANPSMARIYGYDSAGQMVEHVTDIAAQVYAEPEDRQRMLKHVAEWGFIEGFETRHRRKDGKIIWISATLHAARDESGRITHFYGTEEDITRRKEAEAELSQYREGLEDLVKERTTELEEKNAELELEIRERERGEEELRKLSRAIEASRATVVITDREGTIEYANPAFSKVTGYTIEEAIGQNPRILKTETHPREFYENLWKTILSGRIWEGQICNRKKNGELYWESASISPVCNAAGEIAHFVAVKEDITDKRRLDEALQHQYAFLQTVIDAIPSPIFVKDSAGIYVGCNTSLEKFLGRGRDEILGRSVYDLWPGNLAELYDGKDRELFARGGVQTYEAKVADIETGATKDVIFNKATFSNIDGTPGGLVGVVLDITERKTMEETVRESELKLRTILEAVFTGIIIIDPETHRIVDVNGFAERMIGKPRDQIVGSVCHKNVCPAEEGSCPITDLKQRIDQSERRLVRSDGTRIPIIKTVVPVTLDGHTHLLESFVDITKLKEMEEGLKEAKQAADAANQAKSVFLASMSHEIRTPMNAILGFSQLMQRDKGLNPEQREHLDIINRSGEHLLALINDVLEMSKIEAGRTTLHPSTFDLHALLEDIERMFRLRATGKNLQFSTGYVNETPRFVVTDESKLRQVLINLLGNAVKFTDQGGVAMRIGIQGDDPSNLTLRVEVEDTGPGISEEELSRIFEPFQQTAAGARAGGGTGLGLAISREFVKLMGGEIDVVSRMGKGSVFSFHILLAEGDAEAAATREEGGAVWSLEPGQVAPRILIADDNEHNRILVSSILSRIGFEVHEACNGQELVDGFSEWLPDLILTDVRMPVMDGYEAIRRIRSGAQGSEVKIIAITAGAFDLDAQEAILAGADGFMTKPFREKDLLEKIAELTGVRYTYETDGPEPAPVADSSPAKELPPAFLTEQFMNSVREAVIDGDFDRVTDLAGEVEALDKRLALEMKRLADRFDSRGILNIVDARRETGVHTAEEAGQ